MSLDQLDITDLSYLDLPSGPLLVRIYRPASVGPFPAVVDVHGGAWVSGDRTNNTSLDMALARAGILVAALDFRTPPEGAWPVSVSDVNAGIRWLKAHAEELCIDRHRIGGLGTSSGGHQILLNAVQPHNLKYTICHCDQDTDMDASLEFVIACWPVADPWARFQMALEINRIELIRAHKAFFHSEEIMKEANPLWIVEAGAAACLPPLLIIQGTADENVTPDTAMRLADAWKKSGGTVELNLYDGEPHGFITKNPTSTSSRNAIATIERFIALREYR